MTHAARAGDDPDRAVRHSGRLLRRDGAWLTSPRQLGTRFWDLALREHGLAARASGRPVPLYDEALSTFFRNFDNRCPRGSPSSKLERALLAGGGRRRSCLLATARRPSAACARG